MHILKHFYYSFRKGYYSINALGLCDHEQRFRYFSARFKGSSHDSRVLSTSSLLPEIEGSFDPERPRFILADKAYSASDSILVPFRESQLDNDAKKNFNKHHTQARLVIEHAFGQLKQRCVIFCISFFSCSGGVSAHTPLAYLAHSRFCPTTEAYCHGKFLTNAAQHRSYSKSAPQSRDSNPRPCGWIFDLALSCIFGRTSPHSSGRIRPIHCNCQ